MPVLPCEIRSFFEASNSQECSILMFFTAAVLYVVLTHEVMYYST